MDWLIYITIGTVCYFVGWGMSPLIGYLTREEMIDKILDTSVLRNRMGSHPGYLKKDILKELKEQDKHEKWVQDVRLKREVARQWLMRKAKGKKNNVYGQPDFPIEDYKSVDKT